MQNVEIRLRGHIDRAWSDWLGGMSIAHVKGETVLTGHVRDQAALRGLVNGIVDLGIELVSVVTSPRVEGQSMVREKEATTAIVGASDGQK